jgi:hypothetical protein
MHQWMDSDFLYTPILCISTAWGVGEAERIEWHSVYKNLQPSHYCQILPARENHISIMFQDLLLTYYPCAFPLNVYRWKNGTLTTVIIIQNKQYMPQLQKTM